MPGNAREPVRIRLTLEQRDQIKRVTGRDTKEIELSVRELEERIVPRLAQNHNETLLPYR